MPLISAKNICLSFGSTLIFDEISLQLNQGERVALTGRNGTGKTTLMKVIANEQKIDKGNIVFQKGIKVSYLPQELPVSLKGSTFEVVSSGLTENVRLLNDFHNLNISLSKEQSSALISKFDSLHAEIESSDAWNMEIKVTQIITSMKLDAERSFESLSGGQKKKVLIAKSLVNEPDLLLLDEPTNHMDIDSIRWLEEYLLDYKGCIFFVTHDRSFMQRLATRIMNLDRGKIFSSECDYDTFIKRKRQQIDAEIKHRDLFDKILSQEELWIRKGVRARRTRNEGRVKALLKMRKEKGEQRLQIGKARMDIQESQRSGRLVIKALNIGHSYDNNYLFKDFSTLIMRGEKIGVIGPNGSGKTTLLQILLGKLKPQYGEVELGTNLDIIYYDQLRAQLDEEKTVIENVSGGNEFVTVNGNRYHVIGYLKNFLFTPDRARTKINILSGGERNRLLLAKLFAQPSNFLVMDEPTNDLDIETLEILEDILNEYEGTVILVSHDRTFLNNVVTSTIALEGNGVINEYPGGYDDWLIQRKAEEAVPAPAIKKKDDKQIKEKIKKALSYRETTELENLPDKIQQLEHEQKEIHDSLSDPELYKNSPDKATRLNDRYQVVEAEIKDAYERWQYLEELKESFEN